MTPCAEQARNVVRLMRRSVCSPGKPVGAAAALGLPALLVLVLCLVRITTVRADCFPVSDAAYVTVDPLVDKNATEALNAVAQRLSALSGAGAAGDPRQLAALYAVQADAYSILELDHEARAAAAKGLALVSAPTDPLRLELLSTAALNVYTQDGVRNAIGTIESARTRQPPDSLSGVCLEIVASTLERRVGENALATRTAIGAYHDSEAPAREEAHAAAV